MDGSFKAWDPMDDLVLQGCWRSSASHRLQIALHLKRPFRYAPVTFDAGEQHSTACRTINPNVAHFGGEWSAVVPVPMHLRRTCLNVAIQTMA